MDYVIGQYVFVVEKGEIKITAVAKLMLDKENTVVPYSLDGEITGGVFATQDEAIQYLKDNATEEQKVDIKK